MKVMAFIIVLYGGIVGYIGVYNDGSYSDNIELKIEKCYNSTKGKIYGKNSCCGGIVGGGTGIIQDVYNLADIEGEAFVGGIIRMSMGS